MSLEAAQLAPAGQVGRPVYELSGASKTFARRNVHALDRVDLVLTEGSFAAVIGASGCGKSTLLKIMAGLLPPSEGSVVLMTDDPTGTLHELTGWALERGIRLDDLEVSRPELDELVHRIIVETGIAHAPLIATLRAALAR